MKPSLAKAAGRYSVRLRAASQSSWARAWSVRRTASAGDGVFDAFEEALLLAGEDRGAHGRGELLKKVALLVAERLGDDDGGPHDHVATAASAEVGDALAAEDE